MRSCTKGKEKVMDSSGLVWTRLDSSGLVRTRLDSSGLVRTRLDSSGLVTQTARLSSSFKKSTNLPERSDDTTWTHCELLVSDTLSALKHETFICLLVFITSLLTVTDDLRSVTAGLFSLCSSSEEKLSESDALLLLLLLTF